MEFTIPHSLILVCIGLAITSFLFGRVKLGLSVTLSVAFFLGFIQNKDLFFVDLESSSSFLGLYLISGTVLIVVLLYAFLKGD
jgi:hypothetical protein